MSTITAAPRDGTKPADSRNNKLTNFDFDELTTSSILEFLNKEQECFQNPTNEDNSSEVDVESIFDEINRLSDHTDNRSVDEIIREAERLISKQPYLSGGVGGGGGRLSHLSNGMNTVNVSDRSRHGINLQKSSSKDERNSFHKVIEAVQPDSVISEESTPKDMKSFIRQDGSTIEGDDGDTTDTIEDLTEGIETIELPSITTTTACPSSVKIIENNQTQQFGNNLSTNEQLSLRHDPNSQNRRKSLNSAAAARKQPSVSPRPVRISHARHVSDDEEEAATTVEEDISEWDRSKVSSLAVRKKFADKSTNSSPKRCVSAICSPIEGMSITREHALKHEIGQLQERLKDTEERLQSLRIQHDSLSQLHRDLRDNNTHLQDQSELLQLDVQHLTECANILRSELHSARNDRNEALELQKMLQTELEESRQDKKTTQAKNETDAKVIKDLHRQCREMERILMRKHPDSVSALIVASKNTSKSNDEIANSRRLLEQRIAQLETDAREQDMKAQKILANVQARFNSVQSKYETHIADLETQVLSLQEINAKLNSKIESQIRTLDYLAARRTDNLMNSCTQTEDIPEKETRHCNTSTQTDAVANASASTSTTSAPYPTATTNRSNIKQSGLKKPSVLGKMPSSHSDSTIAAYHAAAKEDAHLLATIRGMRVDLAIKDKAMQRLTRELDECKKTIKKLQKERDVLKSDKPSSLSASSTSSRRTYDPSQYTDQAMDSQALKEALNKIKLLEFDYKALHDKRLQDLKTLQTAHERELASCHETVRILQQRLTERDEAFAMQKRRKVPIDYYALKAKVSSLERRHSEREERLHMLVEALSKGRLNGTLDDILNDSNN